MVSIEGQQRVQRAYHIHCVMLMLHLCPEFPLPLVMQQPACHSPVLYDNEHRQRPHPSTKDGHMALPHSSPCVRQSSHCTPVACIQSSPCFRQSSHFTPAACCNPAHIPNSIARPHHLPDTSKPAHMPSSIARSHHFQTPDLLPERFTAEASSPVG